jgi:hypothetical protein
MCREKFLIVVRETQEDLAEIVDEQVGRVEADLQLLSEENAILESERDLAFKNRVAAELERAKIEVERLSQVVGKGA